MKSGCGAVVRAVLFIALWVLPASSIGVLAFGISFAHAVPLATGSVSVTADSDGMAQTSSVGDPFPSQGVLTSAAFSEGTWPGAYTGEYASGMAVGAALSSAQALGPTAPGTITLGKVTVSVSGAASGSTGYAWAAANADLRLYFAPALRGTAPFSPPSIPIDVTVAGSGEALGVAYTRYYGSSMVFAALPGPPLLMLDQWSSFGTYPPAFSDTSTIQVSAGTIYYIDLHAGAYGCTGNGAGYAGPGPLAYGSFRVSATVDPTLAFDQAAFDLEAASLGMTSFTLSDYYSFDVSPNVTSIPVPGTILLMGSGLLGLVGFGWHRRKS